MEFSGQALVIHLTNQEPTILIGDTGPLPSSGGSIFLTVEATNIYEVLYLQRAHESVVGSGNQSVSSVLITNFGLRFFSTTGVENYMTFDLLQVTARAECTSRGVVLSATTTAKNLVINGKTIVLTGEPNQVIDVYGGSIVLNAQAAASQGEFGEITAAGIFIQIDGCTTGPIGLAHADIRCTKGDWNGGGGDDDDDDDDDD